MKISKIAILLFILLVSLLLSTFIGASGIKEGITVNKAIVLKTIIDNTTENNASENLKKIKSMELKDNDFTVVLNNPDLSDYEKLVHVQELLKIISTVELSNNTLEQNLYKNIRLDGTIS